jgi:hypothetical protein
MGVTKDGDDVEAQGELSASRAVVPTNQLDCVQDAAAERIDQLHLFDRLAARLQEARGANEKGQALGPGDRDVEPVPVEKEGEVTGLIVPARGGKPYF